MSKEVKDILNKEHINNLIKIFKEELTDARYYDWDTLEYLEEVVYLLENMSNLQLALYDKDSLEMAAYHLSIHCCPDNTGKLFPVDKVFCSECMFFPKREERADGVDCPDKLRPWLCKKITE